MLEPVRTILSCTGAGDAMSKGEGSEIAKLRTESELFVQGTCLGKPTILQCVELSKDYSIMVKQIN